MDIFRYLNIKKGQADVVFEVLIASVLLGFVLVAGTLAMSSLSNTKCSKSIDIALGDLKLAIEKAAGSSLLTTDFLFDLPYCFGSNAKVTLRRVVDQKICSIYCPGSAGECYLIKYENEKDKVSQTRYLCVQISPVVALNDHSCSGATPGGYALLGLDGTQLELKNGRYKMTGRNLSTQGAAPTLCIYKKEQGPT